MAPRRQRYRGHDRGQVLRDMVVMLADGGDSPAGGTFGVRLIRLAAKFFG
jgi:hypothetical protein